MKIFKHITVVTCLVLVGLLQSCNEDGFTDEVNSAINPDELSWLATTKLKVDAVPDSENFIWETNVLTQEGRWGKNSVSMNIQIQTDLKLEAVDKIDFYITIQEENGFNYTAPFDTKGKFLKSVNTWDSEGNFVLTLNAESVYDLFINDLQYNRDENLAREGDLFEIHWVIYNKNGEVLDSRNNFSANSRYSFVTKLVDVAPPIWEGTFEYEWIYLTANGASYGRLSVGDTGTITMTLQPDSYTVYDVSHLGCGYYYGGPGVLDYNYDTGEVTIIDTTWRAQKWNITNVNGPTITVEWSYYYSAGYDEYGTFTLTRTDGQDWPTNIYAN